MDLDGYFLFPIQVSNKTPPKKKKKKEKKNLVLEIGKCS
jgi:hypothetical protein